MVLQSRIRGYVAYLMPPSIFTNATAQPRKYISDTSDSSCSGMRWFCSGFCSSSEAHCWSVEALGHCSMLLKLDGSNEVRGLPSKSGYPCWLGRTSPHGAQKRTFNTRPAYKAREMRCSCCSFLRAWSCFSNSKVIPLSWKMSNPYH